MNLAVLILHERWSPILVSANSAAVIQRGHVALRQTEVGQVTTSGASGIPPFQGPLFDVSVTPPYLESPAGLYMP